MKPNLTPLFLRTARPLALAACMLTGLSSSANAVLITLGGTDYEITTTTGSYSDNASLLQSQPWWTGGRDVTDADSAATQVGDQLGLPNDFGLPVGFTGPLFATFEYFTGVGGTSYSPVTNSSWGAANRDGDAAITFAIVGEDGDSRKVPSGGATGLMLGTALFGLAALRRRLGCQELRPSGFPLRGDR